jgi:serine/threonine protein kinase
MGEVFRAVDTRLGRTVAIKVVRADLAGRAHFRQRFEREARSISAVNHPHICTLYDIGEKDGAAYLVMEFVEGQPLVARLRESPLPIDLVFRYGAQIARALAAAHARRIIHRDLKPANIMLTTHGVKVLDFGLAKTTPAFHVTGTESGSISHGIAGTPAYMSPEQTRAEVLDQRSDIFSLGCVLYEASCGSAPFRGPSALAILHEIATGVPAAPSTIRPGLPPEFDFVIERALAKDREDRYHSAEELAQALETLEQPGRPAAALFDRDPEELVGREAELARLEEQLAQVSAGAGKTILLTGEPGIGKTSLA